MTTIWTVKTSFGMAIKDYGTDDYRVAEDRAIREIGLRAFESIDEATDDDIRWVVGMGGYVPRKARERISTPASPS